MVKYSEMKVDDLKKYLKERCECAKEKCTDGELRTCNTKKNNSKTAFKNSSGYVSKDEIIRLIQDLEGNAPIVQPLPQPQKEVPIVQPPKEVPIVQPPKEVVHTDIEAISEEPEIKIDMTKNFQLDGFNKSIISVLNKIIDNRRQILIPEECNKKLKINSLDRKKFFVASLSSNEAIFLREEVSRIEKQIPKPVVQPIPKPVAPIQQKPIQPQLKSNMTIPELKAFLKSKCDCKKVECTDGELRNCNTSKNNGKTIFSSSSGKLKKDDIEKLKADLEEGAKHPSQEVSKEQPKVHGKDKMTLPDNFEKEQDKLTIRVRRLYPNEEYPYGLAGHIYARFYRIDGYENSDNITDEEIKNAVYYLKNIPKLLPTNVRDLRKYLKDKCNCKDECTDEELRKCNQLKNEDRNIFINPSGKLRKDDIVKLIRQLESREKEAFNQVQLKDMNLVVPEISRDEGKLIEVPMVEQKPPSLDGSQKGVSDSIYTDELYNKIKNDKNTTIDIIRGALKDYTGKSTDGELKLLNSRLNNRYQDMPNRLYRDNLIKFMLLIGILPKKYRSKGIKPAENLMDKELSEFEFVKPEPPSYTGIPVEQVLEDEYSKDCHKRYRKVIDKLINKNDPNTITFNMIYNKYLEKYPECKNINKDELRDKSVSLIEKSLKELDIDDVELNNKVMARYMKHIEEAEKKSSSLSKIYTYKYTPYNSTTQAYSTFDKPLYITTRIQDKASIYLSLESLRIILDNQSFIKFIYRILYPIEKFDKKHIRKVVRADEDTILKVLNKLREEDLNIQEVQSPPTLEEWKKIIYTLKPSDRRVIVEEPKKIEAEKELEKVLIPVSRISSNEADLVKTKIAPKITLPEKEIDLIDLKVPEEQVKIPKYIKPIELPPPKPKTPELPKPIELPPKPKTPELPKQIELPPKPKTPELPKQIELKRPIKPITSQSFEILKCYDKNQECKDGEFCNTSGICISKGKLEEDQDNLYKLKLEGKKTDILGDETSIKNLQSKIGGEIIYPKGINLLHQELISPSKIPKSLEVVKPTENIMIDIKEQPLVIGKPSKKNEELLIDFSEMEPREKLLPSQKILEPPVEPPKSMKVVLEEKDGMLKHLSPTKGKELARKEAETTEEDLEKDMDDISEISDKNIDEIKKYISKMDDTSRTNIDKKIEKEIPDRVAEEYDELNDELLESLDL